MFLTNVWSWIIGFLQLDTNELHFVLINLFCYISSYDKKKTDAHIERDKYILYHVNKFNAPAKVSVYNEAHTREIIYSLKYTPFALVWVVLFI